MTTCGLILDWRFTNDAFMAIPSSPRAFGSLCLNLAAKASGLRSGPTVCQHPRPSCPPARLPDGMKGMIRWLACFSLIVVLMGWPARLAIALQAPSSSHPLSSPASYRCDGDLLLVQYEAGAVDDPAIPNSLAGTLPGAFVLIDWRDQHLQLPRTNISSAAPSYSDGRWWWRPLSVEQPEFRQRRGSLISYTCEPSTPARDFPLSPRAVSDPGV